MKQKIVVALGGNALGNTPSEQKEIVKNTAHLLAELTSQYQIIICHGNGPQVGMINLGFDVAHQSSQGKIPLLPLPEAGSMSQGYIGYHLQNALMNEFHSRQSSQKVVTLITQVEVDPHDVAFQKPTKPIGSFYSKSEAQQLMQEKKWVMHEDSGRGWRRFVPSPLPINILEKTIIEDLLNAGHNVITAGGGGIPVVKKNQHYEGVSAVIDKDFAAAKLAGLIDANQLIILTAVDYVSINYKKPNETDLKNITVSELEMHLQAGQFGTGSMKPKVEAVIRFLRENPHATAIVSSLENAKEAIAGRSGTIVKYN